MKSEMKSDKKVETKSEVMILSVENITVHYGVIPAVSSISFGVKKGEITTLIGANGAGKTTILRAISGLVKLTSGRVLFKNHDISHLPAHLRVHQRICQVPEGRGIFLNLSVEENLDLGAWSVPTSSRSSYLKDLEMVFSFFPRLAERRKQNSGTLSGGEQQMLAMGRALMAHPEILLLDEPSLGLAPQMIEKIFDIIQKINQEGVTVVLVEQNANQALSIAQQGVVLETGKVVLFGEAKSLLKSNAVRQAYLGEEYL